jgi:hypothetical protein
VRGAEVVLGDVLGIVSGIHNWEYYWGGDVKGRTTTGPCVTVLLAVLLAVLLQGFSTAATL